MKPIILFCLIFLCVTFSVFGQLPPQPVIHGPDTVCALSNAGPFYVDHIANADYIFWTNDWFGFIQGQNSDTVIMSMPMSAGPGVITAYAHNSFGNGPVATFNVTNIDRPDPPNLIEGQDNVCKGATNVQYTAKKGGVIVSSCVWTVPPHANIISGINSGMIHVDFDTAFEGGKIFAQSKLGNCISNDSAMKAVAVSQLFHNQIISINPTTPAGEVVTTNCLGNYVKFTAVPAQTPWQYYFIWKFHGGIVQSGLNLNTYTTNQLSLGNDTVFCYMTPLSTSCVDVDTASLYLKINTHLSPQGGTLSAKLPTVCESVPDTIILENNISDTLIWQRKADFSTTWEVIIPNSSPYMYVEKTATQGQWKYRVIGKYFPCPPDTSDVISINVLQGPGKQTLVPKKDGAGHTNKLFLLCKSCEYDSSGFVYKWGRIFRSTFIEDLCTECDAYDNKVFCMFNTYDTVDYRYYLKISAKDNPKCYFVSYYPTGPGLAEIGASSLLVYPNPSNGSMNIEITSEYSGPVDVIIRDLVGNELKTFRIDKDLPVLTFPIMLTCINKGIYLIETVLGNGERMISKTLIY